MNIQIDTLFGILKFIDHDFKYIYKNNYKLKNKY
jgi:hypothetical protein